MACCFALPITNDISISSRFFHLILNSRLTLIYFSAIMKRANFAYVNHARICSWNWSVLINEGFLLKETTGDVDGPQTYDWPVRSVNFCRSHYVEVDINIQLIWCVWLTILLRLRLFLNLICIYHSFILFWCSMQSHHLPLRFRINPCDIVVHAGWCSSFNYRQPF